MNEYYVTNNTRLTTVVGDTTLKPFEKKKPVKLSTEEALEIEKGNSFIAERRNVDLEQGTAGVGNAGTGAYPIQAVGISQAAYDALTVKDPNTLYVIPEA